MNIALIGYGKMGKTIEPIAIERGHRIVCKTGREGFIAADLSAADVCIEFSSPEVGFENMLKCLKAGKPVVSGTTGWLIKWNEMKHAIAEYDGALFYASNFSLGVNLFFAMNKQVAKMMNQYPQYDVDVHEIHHTQKKDAPSGTAITIAEGIVSEVDRKERYGLDDSANEVLKITAARQDPTPGTHIVKYKSDVDDIQLIHTAYSRKGFAEGAVLAAEFILNKKGMFGMQDLLNLNV